MTRCSGWTKLCVTAVVVPSLACLTAAQEAATWGYSGAIGPSHWSEVNATCGLGKAQSPIDILHVEKKHLPAIEFAYHPSPLKVINNGHSIQVKLGYLLHATKRNRLRFDQACKRGRINLHRLLSQAIEQFAARG